MTFPHSWLLSQIKKEVSLSHFSSLSRPNPEIHLVLEHRSSSMAAASLLTYMPLLNCLHLLHPHIPARTGSTLTTMPTFSTSSNPCKRSLHRHIPICTGCTLNSSLHLLYPLIPLTSQLALTISHASLHSLLPHTPV